MQQIEWDYGFDVEQLQTASSSLGHQFNYQHDALFNRSDYEANAANQYRYVYSPGGSTTWNGANGNGAWKDLKKSAKDQVRG